MSGKSILFIDPFENILSVYQTILEEEGFQVDTVSEISESIDCFSRKEYPVVIMEYFLSMEDTVHFIQGVKKKAPETYIILSTSTVIDDLNYQTLFDNGLDDYLLKPYAPEKLLIHINKGLKQIGLFLEHRELGKESLFEPLAQKGQQEIFNPPFFKKELRRELKKAKRHQNPLSLLLLKIPTKEIMGDRYETFYVDLVRVLKNTLREEDVVGRENGKLGIILSQTDQPGSQTLQERLSSLIQSHPNFKHDSFLKPIIQDLLFQSYTFPSLSEPPEFINPLLEGIENDPSAH